METSICRPGSCVPPHTHWFFELGLSYLRHCHAERFPIWNPGLHGLSHSPVAPPGLSAQQCGTAHSTSYHLARSSSCRLAVSPLHPSCPSLPHPTCLNECFFFNSLVARLPYSLIYWQFWLFFYFKFVAVLLLVVVQGGKVYLPMPPSWPEVSLVSFKLQAQH